MQIFTSEKTAAEWKRFVDASKRKITSGKFVIKTFYESKEK